MTRKGRAMTGMADQVGHDEERSGMKGKDRERAILNGADCHPERSEGSLR
ncbi:MAG: hypothetical protein IJ495_04480 [Bacteroidales bacterium]|nr:hypothetical protein [Bacteroidales bacterium]